MARGLTGEKKKQAMASFILEGINATDENSVNPTPPETKPEKGSLSKVAKKTVEKEKIESVAKEPEALSAPKEAVVTRKKAGRPSKGFDSKKMTFALPEDLVNEALIAARLQHGGNMTAYLIDVIKQDLEKNASIYSDFKKLIGSINK